MKRLLSPYELNQLRSHGIDPEKIDEFGLIPVEYITGLAEIYGREFVVNQYVLIPRVEEDDLIYLALEQCPTADSLVIADIGTGSGCLGVSLFLELKKQGRQSTMYLSDIFEQAIDVATTNIGRLIQKKDRKNISVLRSDLFAMYPPSLQFDLIVANLPYIPSKRIVSLDPSVRDYEPHLALDGGPQGLSVIKKFLDQALARIHKEGKIIIEVDETHRPDQIKTLDPRSIEIHRDQFGKDRFWIITAQ